MRTRKEQKKMKETK